MSAQDQCPSSRKSGKPGKQKLAERTRDLPRLNGRASGPQLWRSLEEASDTPEFRDFLEQEFPAGASEWSEPTTRRNFLRIMGASVALAGAATIPGCRRPEQHIMPYSAKVPEEVIPGKPLYYATSMPLPGGGAEGLLVETHEGRPTKVEGNPLHPVNQGKSTVWSQASILDLYDPDRLKYPVYTPSAPAIPAAKWEDFRLWAKDHFSRFDSTRGKGLAFLVQKRSSPSLEAVRDRLKARFPEAVWAPYDATDSDAPAAGTAAAFGAPMRELPVIHAGGELKAKVIVSLDRDFLDQSDPYNLVHSREFAHSRRVLKTTDPMSRLYVVEPGFSITGSCADHRLRLAPSRVTAFAVLLGKAVLARVQGGNAAALAQALEGLSVPAGEDIPQAFVDAVADDLVAQDDGHGGKTFRKGETLILAGPGQPAAVHALAHALNSVLGNIGSTIRYTPMSADEAAPSAAGIARVAAGMNGGELNTVVCVGVNPVYDAPAELGFEAAYKKVTGICLSVGASETAAASTWSLNGAHYLESWGDTRSWDGTIAPIQPMIAPLYEPALSDIELLALIADPGAGILPPEQPPAAGVPAAPKAARVDDGHAIVRSAWRGMLGGGTSEAAFEKAWKQALHDGVLKGLAPAPQTPSVDLGRVAAEVAKLTPSAAPTQAALEAVFQVGHMGDGRYANNGWLQELPQTGTRVVWDNPALLSPTTAKAMGLLPQSYSDGDPSDMYTQKYPAGRMAKITIGGRSVDFAVWILPGMADNTVILPLGYGRTAAGRVGDGVGFNAYAVRDSVSRRSAAGVTVAKVPGEHPISSTQNHWSLEGRTALVRQVDLPAWQKHGDVKPVIETDKLYATHKELTFGERVGHGELTHTPPNLNIYPNPFYDSDNPNHPGKRPAGAPSSADGNMYGRGTKPEPGSVYSKGPQWGMSIDLSTCTGCGACTIACQAENNIAVVGKKEVAKGRGMAWIRVDRYFVSDTHAKLDDFSNPIAMLHQPVACVHCENAPCETVCPVNATVHGPEGLNYMTYNRCIGTRYCANNCPYKVRRFNFFDYGVTKFNGDYFGKETVETVAPDRGGITGSGTHNKVNPNLIPPRLREKLDEITRMQKNPDVTVRSRGVMEKCTYCIQRINEARIEAKLHDLKGIPDGFVQSACQQACPSGAIVFGDILDETSNGGKGSEMRRMRVHARSYLLLGYLNTRPRTTHMVRVANPNPKLVDAHRKEAWDDPFGHGGGHDDHGHGDHGHAAAVRPGEMSRSAFLRDSAKKAADHGYALSLRVLSGMGGGIGV